MNESINESINKIINASINEWRFAVNEWMNNELFKW